MKKKKVEFTSKDMEHLRNILVAHKGKGDAIKSAELSKNFGIREDDTHFSMRRLIKDCAYLYHIPLVDIPMRRSRLSGVA